MIFKIGVLEVATGGALQKRCEACNFIKRETLAQVFSCEFCEIYKNTFYYRTHLVAASGILRNFAILEPFSNKAAGLF